MFSHAFKNKVHNGRFLDTERIRCRYTKFPITPKAEEMQFKIINDIYPCMEFLWLKLITDLNECTVCKSEKETMERLFFFVKPYFSITAHFHSWNFSNNVDMPAQIYTHIRFDFIMEDKKLDLLFNWSDHTRQVFHTQM